MVRMSSSGGKCCAGAAAGASSARASTMRRGSRVLMDLMAPAYGWGSAEGEAAGTDASRRCGALRRLPAAGFSRADGSGHYREGACPGRRLPPGAIVMTPDLARIDELHQ